MLDTLTGLELACKFPRTEDGCREALVAQYSLLRRMLTRHLAQPVGLFSDPSAEGSPIFLALELVDGISLARWLESATRRQRIEALADVGEALAWLHESDLAHGDLNAKNVMVAAGDRIVLIDPDASTFGSITGRSAVPGTMEADVQGFRSLMESALPGRDLDGFGSITKTLESATTNFRGLVRDATRALRSALADPVLPGETTRGLSDLAAWSKNDWAERNEVYRRVCRRRGMAFLALVDRIRILAAELGIEVKNAAFDDTQRSVEAAESLALGGPRGRLLQRSITLTAQDGDSLLVYLDGTDGFVKPWPFEDRPGLLGTGGFTVLDAVDQGIPVWREALEVWQDTEETRLEIVEPSRLIRCDNDRLLRTLRVLRRAVYPGLRAPRTFNRETEGDQSRFELEPYRELLRAVGTPNFESDDEAERMEAVARAMLSVPASTGMASFQLDKFLDASPSARSMIVRNIATAFVREFGGYVEFLYWFGIGAPSRKARTTVVEIEAKLRAGQTVDWKLQVQVGS